MQIALFASVAQASDADQPLPFYLWDEEELPEERGTLFRSETLPAELSVAEAGTAFRVLYVSTDGTGGEKPVAVSGAIFVPKGPPPPEGWPLISWAHGTTGIADNCAPSRNARSQRDANYIGAWLGAGFAVAASDYQGLGTAGIHPYSNFRAASYGVLDIARAAARSGLPISTRAMLIVGQSQGAGAALAAGGYAPSYAPDLTVAGIVATGLPNLSHEAIESGLAWSATDKVVTAAYALIGYEQGVIHPALEPADIFTSEGMTLHNMAATLCLRDITEEAASLGLNPARTFKPGMLARLWSTDVELRAFPSNSLILPLFVGIGLADTAALPTTTLKLVEDMCRAGTTIAVRAYVDQDHNGVVPAATKDAIEFAINVRAGRLRWPFCQDVTPLLRTGPAPVASE